METIEIKNRFTDELINSFTSENATIKDAVIHAIEKKINLRNADLRDANLSNADLSNADLRNANLSNADLSDAYLSNANLSSANLRGADLRGADLSNADLRNANLSNADLSNAIKLPMHCKWAHGITNGSLIHIGCVKKTIEEWDVFFASDEIIETERNTNEFKQIQAVYEAYKSYLNFLNK